MATRRDSTLYIGLCTSLLAHGALAYLSLNVYVRQLENRLPQPPFDRRLETASSMLFPPSDFALGEATGDGSAIAPLTGNTPQLAPDATQDQPFASLDPTGVAPVGAPPSPAAHQGDAAQANERTRFGVPTTDDNAQPKPKAPNAVPAMPITTAQPKGDEESQDKTQLAANVEAPTPTVETPRPEPSPATDQLPDETTARQAAHDNQPQRTVGQPNAAADPAPLTDSEIDPFSKVGVAEFRPGKTDVKFGRKAKLTRPRVLIAGQLDLIGVANPRVVLDIRTNPAGKVTDVTIAKSSGSENIDGPVRLAAYDWWFEPPTGPAGQPLSSAFLFTVSIVGG